MTLLVYKLTGSLGARCCCENHLLARSNKVAAENRLEGWPALTHPSLVTAIGCSLDWLCTSLVWNLPGLQLKKAHILMVLNFQLQQLPCWILLYCLAGFRFCFKMSSYETHATTTTTTTTTSYQIGCQPEYLKTIPGILKIVEIVSSSIKVREV